MKLILSCLALLSLLSATVLAEESTARCKCFMRGTGWSLSGDSKKDCDTLRDTYFDDANQECVIPKSNWYGAGTFNDVCLAHTGFTNCQMKDRQFNRRSVEAAERESIQKAAKRSQLEERNGGDSRARCQCLNTIVGKPMKEKTMESCESIAGAHYDKNAQTCRLDKSNGLQLEEFRRYCLLFFEGSSC